MKELFNSFSPHFTECKNSIPSSRYSRLSAAGYDGYIVLFPLYFMKIWAKIGQNGDHHLRWWGPRSKNESWLILTSKEIYFQKMIKTRLIFTKFAQIRTSNSTPLPQLQCCYHRFLPWTWTFPVPQLWKNESSQKSHNLDTGFQHCSWGRGYKLIFFCWKWVSRL